MKILILTILHHVMLTNNSHITISPNKSNREFLVTGTQRPHNKKLKTNPLLSAQHV